MNYSVGYRVFEMEIIGGGIASVARLLKQPASFLQYVNAIPYNSRSGGLPIERVGTYYLSAELSKNPATSRFWQRNTIQVGLLLTNQLVNDGVGVAVEEDIIRADRDITIHRYNYSLAQKQRLLGAVTGLNRRFRIIDRLHFLAGLHVQGSLAVVHKYEQRWDSTTTVFLNGQTVSRETKTSRLPDLPGRNFFQWQAMVPLGLELAVYQQRLFVRLEANLGVVGSAYRPKDLASREAHGVGIWLVYQPK